MTPKPDDELEALARTINAKSASGRVNFFAVVTGDDLPYAAIFQSGSRRQTIKLRHRPTEADIDDIVQGLEAWAGRRHESVASLYSAEPPKSPADEWGN